MRCICRNSAGSEAEQGHKVKLKVLTPVNFLTPPSFSVTPPSCDPANVTDHFYHPSPTAFNRYDFQVLKTILLLLPLNNSDF